jgi:hypothetical protein
LTGFKNNKSDTRVDKWNLALASANFFSRLEQFVVYLSASCETVLSIGGLCLTQNWKDLIF